MDTSYIHKQLIFTTTECEIVGARTPPGEDTKGNFVVIKDKDTNFLVSFIADGHSGIDASNIVKSNIEKLFHITFHKYSMECMDDFMIKAITDINLQLIKLINKCNSGTTLTFTITLLSIIDDIDKDNLRIWAFVLGDSQYMISHNKVILPNVVKGKYDIETKEYKEYDLDGVSIIQAVTGSFEFDVGLPLLKKYLTFKDIEEYGITMKNGNLHQVKDVILHNEKYKKLLLPSNTHFKLADDSNILQCLRSLEPSHYQTIQKGIIDFICIDRKYINGLNITTFCDGFLDNNCFTETDIAILMNREKFLEYITNIKFFRESMFYKKVLSTPHHVKNILNMFKININDERFIKDYDPIEFFEWLHILFTNVFKYFKCFDIDWRRSINEAFEYFKKRLPYIIIGSEINIEDIAYLASLRGSADNVSGSNTSFRIE